MEDDVYFANAPLAQLDERRSGKWEAMGSKPGRTNAQGLSIIEEKVLLL